MDAVAYAAGQSRSFWRRSWVVLVSVVGLACAPPVYTYAPVQATSAEIAGAPAVVYDAPVAAGHGDVRVAMLGTVALRPDRLEDSTTRAIHIVVSVRNRSADAWLFDPADTRVELGGNRQQSEVYATSLQITALSPVSVAPGSTATFSLFFALPIQLQNARELPSFELLWTLRTPARFVTERTAFQRVAVPPAISPHEPAPREVTPGELTPRERASSPTNEDLEP